MRANDTLRSGSDQASDSEAPGTGATTAEGRAGGVIVEFLGLVVVLSLLSGRFCCWTAVDRPIATGERIETACPCLPGAAG